MLRKKLVILVGIPGSGKSTWAQNHVNFNTAWVSRDYIRFSMLSDNEDYFAHEKEAYNEYVDLIQHNIDERDEITTIIADATHLNWASRNKLLKQLDLQNVDVETIFFNTSLKTCLRRNELREGRHFVPEKVIRRFSHMITNPNTDPFHYTNMTEIKEEE